MVDLGVKLEIIEKSGAWFTCDGQRLQGKDSVKAYLEENPEVCQKIADQIMERREELLNPAIHKSAPMTKTKAVEVSADDFEG